MLGRCHALANAINPALISNHQDTRWQLLGSVPVRQFNELLFPVGPKSFLCVHRGTGTWYWNWYFQEPVT